MTTAFTETQGGRVRLLLFLIFLFLCFLGGGGSRGDIVSLLYLRPAAVICLAGILYVPGKVDWGSVKVPLWLLAALTGWILIQLVPLPPSLWMQLPGRSVVADGATALGIEQPWRPISFAPDLTLNSLVSLIIPLTALVGFAALNQEGRRLLLPVLIGAAFVSALFGILQISGGPSSPFYLYRITNDDSAVGLFANRNHQAALLALTFPMLALWARQPLKDAAAYRARKFIAGSFAIFLVPMILVTGSRAGLLLGALAIAWACFQYLKDMRVQRGERGIGWKPLAATLAVFMGVCGLFVFVSFSRAQAIQRLLTQGEFELRLRVLPVIGRIAREQLPTGSGFGTFDPVYRIYEPEQLLSPRYLNQAHNDLLELAITGGLPSLIILLCLLVWWAGESIRAFRAWRSPSRASALARVGSFTIFLLLLWSLVDYPLRVPVLAAIFAIACGWLGGRQTAERQEA